MKFKSPTLTVMNNCIFNVKHPRKKPTPIPTASEVKTFDYVHSLLKARWDRMRTAR